MFGEALSIYRRQFGALVLTCALVFLPANLLMSGAVMLGFASLSAGGVADARTHSGPRMDQLGREAFGRCR